MAATTSERRKRTTRPGMEMDGMKPSRAQRSTVSDETAHSVARSSAVTRGSSGSMHHKLRVGHVWCQAPLVSRGVACNAYLCILCLVTDMVDRETTGWIPTPDTFGARLALVRQHMGWGNVKEAADECLVPTQSWRRWERDNRLPRDAADIAGKIAQRTGCDPVWLVFGEVKAWRTRELVTQTPHRVTENQFSRPIKRERKAHSRPSDNRPSNAKTPRRPAVLRHRIAA